MRRATSFCCVFSFRLFISIHALREESDLNELFDGDTTYVISIHALREESDSWVMCSIYVFCLAFQSTLSVRRATYCLPPPRAIEVYFNPRSPWGERHLTAYLGDMSLEISIHALREESDNKFYFVSIIIVSYFNPRSPWGERHNPYCTVLIYIRFQSTLSVRRATWRLWRYWY